MDEKYAGKGLIIMLIAYEDKAKMKAYAKEQNIKFPIAIEPTKKAMKAYGVRGFPSAFVIAPNGTIVWEGHPARIEQVEAAIQKELPNVKKGGGGSGNPASLSLKDDLHKSLKSAAKKAQKGDLAGALKSARSLLEKSGASDAEKADAQYVIEAIEAHAESLLKKAEGLLESRLVYDARELYKAIVKALRGTEYAGKARERVKEIDSDADLEDDLAAGRLFARAKRYETKSREKQARKYYEKVIDKYPETEYARLAKEKL